MVRFDILRAEARMRRWSVIALVAGTFFFSRSVVAQTPTNLGAVQVQLWPEYDQPSMLVILDFALPEGTKLPVNLSIRFPTGANLIAVASQAADGNLVNTDYVGPTVSESWQTITLRIQAAATYHVEYYQPLNRSNNSRQFSYEWPGDYGVSDFTVSVRMPVDTSDMATNPVMPSTKAADGSTYLTKDFGALTAGQAFPLTVSYTKTSEALSASQQDLQPSQPLGASTPGRVMLSNYLPYILGALGLVLIVGGSVYFWQSSRGGERTRERHHPRAESGESQPEDDVYCHQCGTRAQRGDRFCRVCGSRLRLTE